MKKFLTSLKRPRILVPLIVIVIIFFFVFVKQGKPKDSFETQIVTRGEVVQTLSEAGRVEPTSSVKLTFERNAKITGVNVERGDHVKAGEILATIESDESSANLVSAEARLKLAEAKFSELNTNALGGAIADAGLTVSEINLKNAEANLKRIKEQQNQSVENARRSLLSSGLAAYLTDGGSESSSY